MFVIELKIVNDIGKVQTKATKPDTNLQFFSLCKEFYYLSDLNSHVNAFQFW